MSPSTFTLAHLSDPHGTSPTGVRWSELLNKRFSGWLSWKLKRSRRHRPDVLAALVEDLRVQYPDHTVVTGDLTNLALEGEFIQARRWLEGIGAPEVVTVIPGNHDAYVAVPYARSWGHLEPYIQSDQPWRPPVVFGTPASSPVDQAFPTVRVRDGIALIGVCSALPSGWFRATGAVGPGQLERLRNVLKQLGGQGLCRVVLIHHSPVDPRPRHRRGLIDALPLRAALADTGAELVLHGHHHLTSFSSLPGPHGPCPVVGVRSGSEVGGPERRRAQYHLVRIEAGKNSDSQRHFSIEIRGYRAQEGRFVSEGAHALAAWGEETGTPP